MNSMEQFVTTIRTNLNGVLEMTQMFDGLMMTGDNLANRIIVELNRDGIHVPITGEPTIIGYIIRNDGYTLDIPGGVNENGDAYIDIPAIAYLVSGPLSIAIRMIEDERKMVIATASCYVNLTETESIIDTAHRIPDVEELLSYISILDTLFDSTDEAETARENAETARIAAEEARADAEHERLLAEEGRASAEEDRVQDEYARIAAENSRQSAESIREGSENDRDIAEIARVDAESTRVSNENSRIAAETLRNNAEASRQTSETARNNAEASREANTASAIQKINEMTVEANSLPAYSSPTVAISEVNGHKHIVFGLAPGDPFVIKKIFVSVNEMNAYNGNDISVGEFAIISSTVDDPDNAKLYVKTNNGYSYITDLSGAQGIQGPQGVSIIGTVLNNDYTLTVNFSNGTSYTSPSIRGLAGSDGVSITSTVLNQDYTLTVNFSDGTSYTSGSIRGVQGEQGVGIAGVSLDPTNYSLTITLTNGNTYTTSSIRGATGETGPQGSTGNGITGITQNSDYTLTIAFTDGTTFTTPNPIRGAKGEAGLNGTEFAYEEDPVHGGALTITFL